MKRKIIGIFVCMLLIGTTGIAVADWSEGDGYKMHFPQLPDPYGWDVDFHDWQLGDDWKCSETGPVTDIHFWYSWAKDIVQEIPWIQVSIWSDEPGSPSHPKELKWSRQFSAGDFIIAGPWTGDQGWYNPPNLVFEHDHFKYYQINIKDIQDPFTQQEGIIYWLVIKMPYYSYPYPAIGWKTSKDHWNDNAVYGGPTNWIPLWDPKTPTLPIDFAFVITGEVPKPDLSCDGALEWLRVKPGAIVTGSFVIGNIGDPGSMLDWEVTSWPAWGTWTFNPANGTGLPAGSWVTVNVTVKAPPDKNTAFTGIVKIINSGDPTDYCEISVVLKTPRVGSNTFVLNLLERFPNAFPILRYLMGL